MKAHNKEYSIVSGGAPSVEFKKRDDDIEHCSYCGSISVEKAIEVLKTTGAHYSGADWKYGWPHKFYLELPKPDGSGKIYLKFYNEHLKDATQDQVKEYSDLTTKLLGIHFQVDEKGVYFSAPNGFQTWGTVGAVRPEKPEWNDNTFGPKVPEWFTEKWGNK